MKDVEVFKAGGHIPSREEQLRHGLADYKLDGRAAVAIFGTGDAFISPGHHLVIARNLAPEGEDGRVVAAMAIASTWLDDDAPDKIFSIRSYMLSDSAVDDPYAPTQFGIMARAARRHIDRRAEGIGLAGIGDPAAVDGAEERFQYLASGVGGEQYIERNGYVKEIMGGVVLTAVVRFPRPLLR